MVLGIFKMAHSLREKTRFNLLKKQELFLKTWSTVSQFRVLCMKEQCFHTKLPCQKSMLRQIEWRVQNRPITKNGLSPMTTSFFWKFDLSIRTSHK